MKLSITIQTNSQNKFFKFFNSIKNFFAVVLFLIFLFFISASVQARVTTGSSVQQSYSNSAKFRDKGARQQKIEKKLKPHYKNCENIDISSLAENKTQTVEKSEGQFCFSCSVKKFFGFQEIQKTTSTIQSKVFKEKLQKSVIGQIESKIFHTKILKACIKGDRNWFRDKNVDSSLITKICKQKNKELRSSIKKSYPEMKVNLALSVQPGGNRMNRVLSNKALWFDKTPNHFVSEFNKLDKLNQEERSKAENIYISALSKLSLEGLSSEEFKSRLKKGENLYTHLSKKNLSERDRKKLKKAESKLRSKAKDRYSKIVSELPILAYLNSGNPKKAELSSAFEKIEERLEEFLKSAKGEDVDMGFLLSFAPLVEELLNENQNYCLTAEKARIQAEKDESLKNWALLGVGVLSAIPCFVAGPVGATACLTAGMSLGAGALYSANRAKKQSFGRLLTSEEFETVASLKDKEKEEFLAKLFLPLGAWGTTAVPARAASKTVSQAVKRIRDKSKSSGSSKSQTSISLNSQSMDNILNKQKPRLLSSYDNILKTKSTEEQDIIMSAIIGLEAKGLNKQAIQRKLNTAIGNCKAK